MNCPKCGQPVTVGSNGTTSFYVPLRPAHRDEPACTVCGSLDENEVRARVEEEGRV